MRDFGFIILLIYFAYRLFMGFIVLYNWNSPEMVKVRKSDGKFNINDYYYGVFENASLLSITYLLYDS